ncbi:hypothetical protein OIU76_014323 [Salix suchowensis]|nr:hypothetical protein OIU76_014323 [Salix suchowensis]
MFTLVYELVLHYMMELTHTFGNQLRKKKTHHKVLLRFLFLEHKPFYYIPCCSSYINITEKGKNQKKLVSVPFCDLPVCQVCSRHRLC